MDSDYEMKKDIQMPKAIKNDFVEKNLKQEPQNIKENKSEEKTAEVLREFNEYLRNEKKKKY